MLDQEKTKKINFEYEDNAELFEENLKTER